MSNTVVASYLPVGGTVHDYSADDLRDPVIVEQLFDYCQILEGIIHPLGWRLLFATYGVGGLLEINRKSDWFSAASDAEASESLKYYSLIAGYDPEMDAIGQYDDESAIFVSTDGGRRRVQWGVPWTPAVARPSSV